MQCLRSDTLIVYVTYLLTFRVGQKVSRTRHKTSSNTEPIFKICLLSRFPEICNETIVKLNKYANRICIKRIQVVALGTDYRAWCMVQSGTEPTAHLAPSSVFTAQCTLVQMRGLGIACRPSVRLSVTLVSCDHIGWKSWKLIARTISPTPSLFVAKKRSRGTWGNFGETRGGVGKKWHA